MANWQPPAFNPEFGLFYTHENNGFNIVYLTDPDPRGSMGLGGKRVAIVGTDGNAFNALVYRTGDAVWRHEWPGSAPVGAGVLTTAAGLVFTGYIVDLEFDGRCVLNRRAGRRSIRQSRARAG